jgi:subtilisin family serine protease
MKRMMCVRIAAFVTFGLMSYGATPVESAAPKPYADRQVIVKLKRGLLKTEGDEIRGELRSKTKCRFKLIDAELWEISGMTVEKAIEKYRNDPRIEYIEPNYTVTALDVIPNDPSFPLLWGMHNTGQSGGTPDADIDAPEAWGIQTGTDVIIGIIDTGVDRTHPDLAANMWTNPGEIAGNGIDDDGNGYVDDVRGWDFVNNDNDPMDDHGHGTHCAGTIAGIGDNGIGVAGVCWHARIMALKFLDAGGYGSTSDAVLALEYATANGARLTSNSWGGGNYSTALYDAIAAARNVGALFIAAAGNDGVNNDSYPHYPSSYDLDNIIAVAATDRNDALANFSCYGAASVDLGAPGVDIYSSLPGSSYGYKSGTSMATPHVSGAVALVWSEYPTASFAIVKARMLASVDALAVLKGKTVSGGRLNVFKLLAEPDSIPPAAVGDVAVGDTASNAVTLVLTATGDDGTTGRASAYDVRYSLSPIDSNNFDSADQASGEPRPAPAGSQDTIEVRGLNFNSTYYFALKVQDEWGNESPLSNVTYATTLGVPHMAVGPDSLADSLLTGAISKRSIAIENTEPRSTLDFCVSIEGVGVSVSPACGTVSGPAIANVEVTFDAAGLYGGDYSTRILIAGNDTTNSVDTIIALLHVTGASDIAVSDTLLDYGPVFLGGVAADTVTVRNEGTDTLRVNGISTDNADFTVDATPFVLGIGGRRDLIVTFGPSEIGLRAGTLTILSDDPDEGEVDVALRGEGLEPPVISVAPDSLADSLLTGQTSTHQLTISNTGASDLIWGARTQIRDDHVYALNAPVAGTVDPETGAAIEAARIRTAEISASLRDLTGVRILWDMYHGEFPSYLSSTIVADVTARGAVVTESSQEITAELLDGYDLIWLHDMSAFGAPEVDAVQTWVRGGGGVLFETDQSSAEDNALLSALGSGITYLPTDAMSGATSTVYPHETTRDVASVYLSNPLAQLAATAPAGRAVDDMAGSTVCAYDEVGWGRVFAVSDEVFVDGNIGLADNQLFANQVIDWLTPGTKWLTVTPAGGTLSAGGSDTLDVTFDATGMFGGGYDSDVMIVNNDPLHPEVRVPAHLHVTGAPDIVVSDMLLDYGPVFLGGIAADTVAVRNEGTDTLRVNGISTDNADFTVDATPFVLGPEGMRALVVTFGPSEIGLRAGTLTILSDDPDEGEVDVALRGEGLEPPVISVAPDSLADSLLTGQTSTHQLTISNTGASDLSYSIMMQGGVAGEAFSPVENQPIMGSREATPNETNPTTDPIKVEAVYSGAYLLFGISSYGEIMPYQFPVGNEHLMVGAYAAGYTVAYRSGGVDHVCYAAYSSRVGIVPVSYTELVNDPALVVVEVVTETTDLLMKITQRFTFVRADKYIRIETTLRNLSGGRLDDVVFKSFADWDMDGTSSGDNWNYDIGRHMVYAWEGTYAAIGGNRAPDYMDIDGWNDYSRRTTTVGYPEGPVLNYDGLEILHYEMGNLDAGASTGLVTAYAAGDDLIDLRLRMMRASIGWLSVTPAVGTVPAGGNATVDVTFDAMRMYGGNYDSDVVIVNNDPLHPKVRVPAHLHVTGAPDIAVSDTLIDFGIVWVGHGDVDTLVISNEGTDTLFVSGIEASSERFGVDSAAFALAPNDSRPVSLTCNAIATGITEGVLTISSNDPDEDTLLVSVRFEATLPPEMQISPASLAAGLHTGESLERVLTIENGGGDDLVFAVTERDAADGGSTGLAILMLYGDYTSPKDMRDSLSAFPDIERVDVFNAWYGTPSLGTLLGYDCVIVMNSYQYKDRWTLGDALADYVDRGGGVVLAHGTFVGYYAVAGRFGSGGYYPFNLGTRYRAQANLGDYDHGNPIMAGVTSAHTNSPAEVTIAAGAVWVATWSTGIPFVATKGEHVVGANISLDNVSQNEWSGDIPRLIHNAVLWASGGGGICWAREAPASGVVAPLGSAEVAVTFNPRSRCAPGGSFDDTLVVSSNAPAAPSVRVPLHLDVIATPDIAVGDTLLDFGPVLVGNAAERTIVVANYGAAVLSVSAFTVDNPVFTSSPSSFSLAVNEERVFTVVFEPVASGLIEGTLTIASNDPDQPVVGVAVRGQALMPPAISVIPDSLNASLMRGDSLVRIVEIRNDGVADLEWSIYPLDGGDVGSFTLPPAQEPDGKPSPDEGIVMERAEGVRVESGELTAALADLAGVRVLYDYAHSQYSDTYWWSTLIADLKARGATVEMNRVPITPAVLAGCNVYWITDVQAPFTASEIVALRDWVEAGGGLLLEGDQSADAWNAVLAGMGAGIEYSSIAGTKGVTTQIRPHVTTLGVSSVLLYNNVGHLSSVSYPARLLLNDMAGLANAAHSVAGKGRIVAFADEPFENDYIVQQDNRVFGNQIMDWLVHGANWLNTMPLQGTVPGGDTAAVAVTIDPRGLYGGGYDARLHITSNVPSTPEVTVPVHASVTGIPALAVSDTTLDFGDVLIGATEPRTLVATNVGTDLLVVSGFRLSGAGFAADTSGVTLAVHGTDTLIVTLTPPVEGPMSGLLTICTNDPADTARTIELTGNGLVPPQIVVSPGALSDTLYTGGVSSHILEIENPGEHDLNFTIGENGSGNRILFITAGADVSFVRSALLAYSDVSAVDVFNGGAGTPSLGYLLSYRCVIVAGGPCADPVAAGNVLADYADRGGGVILTFASHMSGIALQGRIMGAGYSPFTVAPGISTNGTLGTYETGHPIMAGIDWMQSLVYSATSLVPGAHLVAAWSDGVPAVATMGNHVVGANVFTVNNGSSPGLNTIVIARLLCNAMLWMSGGNICWMDAQPSAGAVSPHASAQVTVTFSMRNEPVCITEGDYLDTLVVETNVPTMPRVNVPLHLFAIAAPDVVAADSVPDFGAVMLGSTAAETLIVANAGVNPLVVSAITSDHPSFTADPGAFSLAPNASRIVTIRFAPVDPGAARGTLTIASNDPDEAQTHAVLAGYGLSNVSLVSPHGGESWTVGEPDTIRWTVTGPEPDSVTVLLSRDGGVSFADTLASGIAGAISYAWVVEPPPTTEASIMIRSYRGGAVSGCDASDSLFAIVVTTGVDDGDALPAVNALAQNCPNPFNPVTRIDFSLRMSGPVSLRIYDSAGRLVRVLIDEPRNAGRHSAIWDGKDAGGRLAASGVYYCRITAGSFSATRKMILLR